MRLHLESRRVPAALCAFVGCGLAFQATLRWYGDSGSLGQQIAPIFEAAVAAIVAVSTRSPIGELERASGRWLPFLRLGTAVALTIAAFAALAAGASVTGLVGGTAALLRNVAGMVGVGLLFAPVVGGSLSWIATMGYLALAEVAVSSGWHSPWIWPTRPPGDLGGAVCATLVLVAGLTAIGLRGARDSTRE